jgi:hypothetical protein
MCMIAKEQLRRTQAKVSNDNGIYTTLGIFICELLRQLKEKFFGTARITGVNFYMDFEE